MLSVSGPMSYQLYDNSNVVISFQNPTEPNENPSPFHMIKSLVYCNIEYDTAVLELTDPNKLPPKMTLYPLEHPNVQHVHIIGYGHASNKKTLDPKCKVISPMDLSLSAAKMWLEDNKDVLSKWLPPDVHFTPEQWGYHGCDKKEKIIFNCYLEKGSSGAPILAFYYPFEAFVAGMVTNGLPNCFWNLTPDGQSRFPDEYRFEMGTRMSAIYAELIRSNPDLANDLFQQH